MNTTNDPALLQPQWSQTGKTPRSNEVITYNPEKDQPGQRIVARMEDGTEVSVPHLPYVWMLDPSGHVCPVVISTNRDASEIADRYRSNTLQRRRRKGWVLWDFDPQAEPAHGGLTAEQWAEKRDQLRAERRAKAAASARRFGNMANDRLAQLLAAVGDNLEAQAQVTKLLLEKGDLKGAERVAARAKRDAGGE